MPETVAFDESGNTGDNLLDETQPTCSLASVHIDANDADALVAEVIPVGRRELHFADLRRSAVGREAIIAVLSSDLLSPQSARVTPMHKPFAVVARLFDYIIEPTIYARGQDVLDAGMQLDFVNVLYRRGPSAGGTELWKSFLKAFVVLMRGPTDDAVDEFMRTHRACLLAAGHPLIRLILEDVPDRDEVAWRARIDQPAGIGGRDLLDPVPTMLVENCTVWPTRLGVPIRIIHDENNVVRRWTPLIESLSRPDAVETVGRYWGERMELPLQVEAIELVASHDSSSVQLADIIGGAAVAWLAEQTSPGGTWAPLANRIDLTVLPELIENEVWPMPSTPFHRFR